VDDSPTLRASSAISSRPTARSSRQCRTGGPRWRRSKRLNTI
jgi:hypothetical protein